MRIKIYFFMSLLCFLYSPALQAQSELSAAGVVYDVELYTAANYPIALAFTPDGWLFYTEKTTGNVRVVSPEGVVQREPVINLPTSGLVERGMLGITLDPAFDENGMLWVMHTAEATARDFPANNVVRFRTEFTDGIWTGLESEIMFSIPITDGSLIHNGGNLHFDRNGLLYVTVGDYENAANPQDLTTIPGKIHRFAVTDEGLVPAPDNPFTDEGLVTSIYAYGLRNSWDFDFDIDTDFIYATENGLHCDDEINLILRGFNYGAGEGYVCGDAVPDIDRTYYLPGLLSYTPTDAPTGIVVYDHPAVPTWEGRIFFCSWNDGIPMRMITLTENRNNVVSVSDVPLPDGVQCRIDIEIGSDGELYFTTVNADGGAIYRIVPRMDPANF